MDVIHGATGGVSQGRQSQPVESGRTATPPLTRFQPRNPPQPKGPMVLANPTGTWTAADGAALYGLERWGDPYFCVSERGHVMVQPRGDRGGSLDLVELVQELQGRDLSLPLLIRFDDILEDRLERLHGAFERAIAQYGYGGRYQGVFPVKCNQQRHVVEQLVESGRRWHFGLEAGSKAELLIALSLLDDPEALLICNGYKDQR